MLHFTKIIRISFFAITLSLFLIPNFPSSFSQNNTESFEDFSDEDLRLIEEYLAQAEYLFEQRYTEGTIFHYDKVLAIDPLNIDALNGKAIVLDFIGDSEEAILLFDMVLEIDSQNVDALLGKGFALESLGREDEATSYFENVLEPEDNPQIFEDTSQEDLELLVELLEQADALVEEESYVDAISLYDEILAIDSSNTDALLGKAFALESLGRDEEALPILEKIVELESIEEGENDFGEIITPEEIPQTFEDASQEDLELLIELLEQADDLMEEESYFDAISLYDQALVIDSSDTAALNGKALALDSLGRHDEAISLYDQALVIDSSDTAALNGKALALDSLGRHDEAISLYDQALKIDSLNTDALFGKALALENLGREEESILLLEKIVEQTLIDAQLVYKDVMNKKY